MQDSWISQRAQRVEVSGIRRAFELGRSLKDPVNLSIGQPHFDVPEPIRHAAERAVAEGHNSYTLSPGIPELRDRLRADVQQRFSQPDRELMVTSGTMGGLMLALLATVNPGDEVIIFDPYFVAYPHLITLAGGKTVYIDTYPDFSIDVNRVEAAMTERTKVIMLASPANPTGVTLPRQTLRQIAQLCRDRGVLLMSDEIYRAFHFDEEPSSPAEFSDEVLVFEGFGKTYGCTGWRLGHAHGPKPLIDQMTKLQQFTFICAPSIAQYGALAALDFDVSGLISDYRQKRDLVYEGLRERFEVVKPGGAFYIFPKAPGGSGTAFCTEAVKENLVMIAGNTFSQIDTHFRISFAAENNTLEKGIEILNRMAGQQTTNR